MHTRNVLASLAACAIGAILPPVVCAAQAAPGTPQKDTSSALLAIEKTLEARRQELHIPGVAFAIVQDDKVIYSHGFGMRDVANERPVTPDTLFAIGSSTKAFTAMTVMMSADAGKLALTDSPKKYLPYFHLQDSDADQHITLSDLLCHRSGLPRTDLLWATGVLNSEQLIRALGDVKPTAKLGEKFQYQNLMFLTAGQIVGKVQGTTWTNVVTKRILRPLGMSHSDTDIDVMQRADDYALGYTWDDSKQEYKHLNMRKIEACAPAGAINSNVKDMAKWVQFMLDGGVWNGKRLVSEKNFAELTEPRITVAGEMKYGYGWFLRNWNGHKVVEHGGNIDGFNAEVALMPDQHLGFVMLTNVSASSLGETALTTVWENLVGTPETRAAPGTPSPPQIARVFPPADGPLKELFGPYKAKQVPLTLEVAVRNGKVALVVPGQPPYSLIEKSKDTYAMEGLPADFGLLIHRNTSGSVVGATLQQPAAQGSLELTFGNTPIAADLPPVEEVMQKYIAAVGGEAAMRRHHSMVVEMHLESPNQGVTGTILIQSKAPLSISTETTMVAQKKRIFRSRDFFDGRQGGSENSLAPVTPKSDPEIADAKVADTFYRILDWHRLYKSVKLTARAKVDAEDCYITEWTPPTGNPILLYLSTKTFLPVKEDTATDVPGLGPVPFSESYSDYRTADGIKIPFRRVVSSPINGETISTITRVRFNVKIPDSTFRIPPPPSL